MNSQYSRVWGREKLHLTEFRQILTSQLLPTEIASNSSECETLITTYDIEQWR